MRDAIYLRQWLNDEQLGALVLFDRFQLEGKRPTKAQLANASPVS